MNLNIVILCRCLHRGKSMRRLTSKVHFPTYASLRLVWPGLSYRDIDLSSSITILMPSETSIYSQPIFMANFQCPECNICFATPHQRRGHCRLVHQSTCEIRTATGRIIVSQSIDGKYPCPVDCCKSTFERSDNLQCHFKVQHAEQNNSALNQILDDNVQKAMSLGMLI